MGVIEFTEQSPKKILKPPLKNGGKEKNNLDASHHAQRKWPKDPLVRQASYRCFQLKEL
jgi:hypothetical protein